MNELKKTEQIVAALVDLPIEKFVDTLCRVFDKKVPFSGEERFCRSRFFLGVASSNLIGEHVNEDYNLDQWEPWELEAIAYVNPQVYGDTLGPDEGLCQEGTCSECGTTCCSNVKNGICPICGASVHLT